MHKSIMDFGIRVLSKELIENKIILNVGSLDVNGSWESLIKAFKPKFYIGTDIQKGKGVDLVIAAEKLYRIYPESLFDLIVSTETLEHIKLWKQAIINMKLLLKVGGTLIITTRSRGCNYHPYPDDYWRYEIDDMKTIFSEFDISVLEVDTEWPGILMVAEKIDTPKKLLNDIELFKVDKNYNGIRDKLKIKT